MPSITTRHFRHYNADQFKEAFNESSPSRLYMFIGKQTSWVDDNLPPTPVDAVANTEYSHWNDMMSAKKTETADASYVINRNDWTSGTVYTEYNDLDGSLYSNAFYVMTDDYNVYKCLFNNNGGPSTTKPTGTSSSIITTADGYKWKFMYSVTAAEAVKFVTDNYIPVKTLTADDGTTQWTVQQAAANGSIEVIDITAGGSTFNNYNTGTLQSATNTTVLIIGAGADATDDVYVGSVLYTVGGTGSGQQAEIIDYVGSSKTVTLGSAFSTLPDNTTSYSIAPKVTISGDGSGATAIATMNTTSNTVYSSTITAPGSDYSVATVVLSANGLSSASADAYVSPPGGHGSDSVKELGGYNVLVNTRFDQAEGGTFTVTNDFRKIGLLRDPLLASGATANGSLYDQTTRISIDTVTGSFDLDETITGGTSLATGTVVDANSTTIKVTSVSGNLVAAETITGGTSSATANVSALTPPDLQKFSGDVMYIEQRGPVARASDQIEDIRLVITF